MIRDLCARLQRGIDLGALWSAGACSRLQPPRRPLGPAKAVAEPPHSKRRKPRNCSWLKIQANSMAIIPGKPSPTVITGSFYFLAASIGKEDRQGNLL